MEAYAHVLLYENPLPGFCSEPSFQITSMPSALYIYIYIAAKVPPDFMKMNEVMVPCSPNNQNLEKYDALSSLSIFSLSLSLRFLTGKEIKILQLTLIWLPFHMVLPCFFFPSQETNYFKGKILFFAFEFFQAKKKEIFKRKFYFCSLKFEWILQL